MGHEAVQVLPVPIVGGLGAVLLGEFQVLITEPSNRQPGRLLPACMLRVVGSLYEIPRLVRPAQLDDLVADRRVPASILLSLPRTLTFPRHRSKPPSEV